MALLDVQEVNRNPAKKKHSSSIHVTVPIHHDEDDFHHNEDDDLGCCEKFEPCDEHARKVRLSSMSSSTSSTVSSHHQYHHRLYHRVAERPNSLYDIINRPGVAGAVL